MLTYKSSSCEETEQIGSEFAKTLAENSIVILKGSLGAGKTAFARGVASILAKEAEVSSPSYTILQKYMGKIPVLHFDLYRLSGLDDLESIGFYDELLGEGIKLIEWGELFQSELPKNHIVVEINKISENEREISIYENTGT